MKRAAAVLLGATALSCAAAPAYAAEGDPLTGYWTRTNPGLPVPVQAPTPVPEGGTFVSGDPSGPVAVSALRSDLAAGLVGVELRLTIADALGTPAVQACPTTDRWVPEQGGRLEAAPDADCSAPLDATVDGDVLVVPLPPGLDAVNVLLRPKPGAVFSVTMERATAESVVTAPDPATASDPAPAPAPVFGPPTTTAPPPTFDTGFDSSIAAPLPPAEGLAAEPLVATPVLPEAVAPAAPAPQTAPIPVSAPLLAARPVLPVEDRRAGLLAAAVLALVGAQALRLARQPATAPRALGGAARRSRPEPVASAPQVVVVPARGVGRFRTEAVVAPATPTARGVGRFRTARQRPPVRI